MLYASLLSACTKSTPEQAIVEHIAEVQAAVEDKSAGRIMDILSDEFIANRELDKKALYRLLIAQFLQHNNINVIVSGLEVELAEHDPYRATMSCSVIVTGAERLLPDQGRIYQVSGRWLLDEGEWLLASLNWQ